MSVTVTIPATVTAGASDTARLTFTSHHDHTKSANVALTTTAQMVYGLTAAPANAVKYASPGETVAYQVQVTNLGNSADSFDVKVAATWPSTAPNTVGPLDPGASLNFDVFVHIPLDPGAVDKDTCRLTISSQSSPDQMSAVQMETFASMSRLFLPIVTHATNK